MDIQQIDVQSIDVGSFDVSKEYAGKELWYHVAVEYNSTVFGTLGGVTFGDAFQASNVIMYPMPNNGFHTVGFVDIPKKGGQQPIRNVVSFKGQTSCGKLGITNHTDRPITCRLVAVTRVVEE